MGGYYLVIKRISGRRYYYHQRTWREGKKVKCHCIYRGPVDTVPQPAARLAYSSRASMNADMHAKRMTPADMGMAAARRDDRCDAQIAEIKRRDATILSIDDTEYEIVARTDKGTIRTTFDENGKIRHEWDTVECTEREERMMPKGIDKTIAEKGFYESPECQKRMRERDMNDPAAESC